MRPVDSPYKGPVIRKVFPYNVLILLIVNSCVSALARYRDLSDDLIPSV